MTDKQAIIKQFIESNNFTLGEDLARNIAENSYTNEQQSGAYINGFMDCLEIFLTLKIQIDD